jgi:two-component system, chemotaxis family, response regulator PixH
MYTVLVVEDTATDRSVLAACLQKAGFFVLTAASSEEALDRIQKQKPDAIVLDVVLPGRSGFEFCRDLKADTQTVVIPIVLCSTKDTAMDKFWGMKQGAEAFLTKPVDQEELVRTVFGVIRK